MKLQQNVPLAGFTSLRAGGQAEAVMELAPGDDLLAAVKSAAASVIVLGYGTNVLISDKGLPGMVIINKFGSINVSGDMISADSGANWDELVQRAIANDLWGLEFTSGIPGGVGAAVAGGIAAYGHRIADRLVSAEVLDTQAGQIETWPNGRFNFGYRRSDLQLPANAKYVVITAQFQLATQPTGDLEYQSALKAAADLGLKPDSLSNRRQIILEARRRAGSLLLDTSHGPWTAGSFFKNPMVTVEQLDLIISYEEDPGRTKEQVLRQNKIHGQDKLRVSAALVLLAAGFKRGQTWGDVRLHPNHILKVENTGGATAQQIYDVVQEIMATAKQKLDVTLEPEVRFLGEF
jgi:UDP-N-acetylmuramate dehydrogenase